MRAIHPPIATSPGVLPARRFDKSDWVCIAALVLAVCAVYAQTARFEYVNLDDPMQVAENAAVQNGLTRDGVRYAFSATPEGNFMPVTWLSHMAVVEIGGHDPMAHHVVNVVLHAIMAVLVYAFWRLATGATGASAVAAGLFALHPLRVESVAWIAERKDVLSGVFWMLTLLAYLWYSRGLSVVRYICVAIAFTVGLLCKSMLVTLPCVMLLLDYWPLRRATHPWKLVAEKLPFFALAAACSAITYQSQEAVGAVGSIESLSIAQRLWNAPAAYGTYLVQTVWPINLAVMYPYLHSNELLLRGSLGLVLLIALSAIAVAGRRTRPYFIVGWLWYLGTLVPVIGLVQVGQQSHADRYTYIPHIGLFVALVWTTWSLSERSSRAVRIAGGTAVAVVVAMGTIAWWQTGFWKDSETLFARSLAITQENAFSEGNYAVALIESGKYAEAEKHLHRVIAMGKTSSRDYHNLGLALLRQNRPAEAQYFFEVAVLEDPKSSKSWLLLGQVRFDRRQWLPAVEAYRKALAQGVGTQDTRVNLATALGLANQPEEAAKEFETILNERPNDAAALFNYGSLLVNQLKFDEAAAQFERLVEGQPNDAESMYFLAICRALQSRPEESVALLARAISLKPAYRERAAQEPLLSPLRAYAPFQRLLAGQ